MNTLFLQLAFNGLVSGLLLALLAVGFNLTNTTRVFHIAHGSFYVGGAYAFYAILPLFQSQSLFFVLLSALAALLLVMLVASMVEVLIYQPLSRKKSGQGIFLIVSMGIYLFIINAIAMFFGNQTKSLQLSYARRKCTVESVFWVIKSVPGFRQFLLRSIENVKGEWDIVSIAWNLKRLN